MNQPTLFDLSEYTAPEPEAERSLFEYYFGPEDAEKIERALGGLNIRVPVNPNAAEYKKIEERLGSELTEKLARTFGGEPIYIGMGRFRKINEKKAEVRARYRELLQAGKLKRPAIQQCAREFKISDRHVRRIIS